MTTGRERRRQAKKAQARAAMESQEKRRRAGRENAEAQAARDEVNRGGDPGGWGTGAGALGIVKAASEEAKHSVCVECGSSGGRHMRGCPNHDTIGEGHSAPASRRRR